MTFKQTKISLAATAIGLCLAAPLAAHAADAAKPGMNDKMANPTPAAVALNNDRMVYSDRANRKAWGDDKEALERDLAKGHDKAWYVKAITDKGYQITSVNVDKPTEVEYEVVKGRQTYEVKVDFDKASHMGKDVDVSTNMWRADSTKRAMAGDKVPMATGYVKGNEAYSDRGYMKSWSGEKDRMEKQLGTGHDRGYYLAELKKMGYQVTSTNDNEKDYVEYEVVKGKNSYEVQVDFDNGKSTKVDVATNLWQAEGTEKALDAKKH